MPTASLVPDLLFGVVFHADKAEFLDIPPKGEYYFGNYLRRSLGLSSTLIYVVNVIALMVFYVSNL